MEPASVLKPNVIILYKAFYKIRLETNSIKPGDMKSE